MQSYVHAMTNGKFPSPCGDKLRCNTCIYIHLVAEFPSPCGDGTSNNQPAEIGHQVFAPLRGWYSLFTFRGLLLCVFAPLRGLYMKLHEMEVGMVVFAPLRG